MKASALVLVLLLVVTCSPIDYIVESDYSYHGNFHKYRSYNFASNMNFPGSEDEKEVVENYMKSTLSAWGYDLSDRRPDLLVFYAVFYDDLRFQGFEQPEFQTWVKHNFANKEIVFKQDTLPDGGIEESYVDKDRLYTKEDYDPVLYTFKKGTILISLFDRKRRKTVWQGYASGVFGEDQERNDRIMRSAIIRIMDEYRLLAFGAS